MTAPWPPRCARATRFSAAVPRPFLLPLALLVSLPAEAAPAPDYTSALRRLAPHDASYQLHFAGSPDGTVVGGVGSMDYRVMDACDAWATQQRLVLDIVSNTGTPTHMVSDYTTYEAKNGRRLRFRLQETTDGARTSNIAGVADIVHGHGMVHYTAPRIRAVTLPAGTLFPMAHTAHIIAQAEAGEKFFALPLFDGSSETGAEDTFVVVTGHAAAAPQKFPFLSGLASDRVNIVFYDHDSLSSEPDYATAMRYWTNGVAGDVAMNFGDFVMDGTLTRLTPGRLGCPGGHD